MGNHETTCDICKNDPSITCNGACDVVEERLTGRNASRDARIREERARRVGEAVLDAVHKAGGPDRVNAHATHAAKSCIEATHILDAIAAALRGEP